MINVVKCIVEQPALKPKPRPKSPEFLFPGHSIALRPKVAERLAH